MNKPVLVVMAAGMGSRYGGMKQIDPVGPNGQVIMDYSLYDARRAGFETVIFVIKHEIEDAFKAAIGDRVAKAMKVKYAFQQLEELPAGFAVPEGRCLLNQNRRKFIKRNLRKPKLFASCKFFKFHDIRKYRLQNLSVLVLQIWNIDLFRLFFATFHCNKKLRLLNDCNQLFFQCS